MGLVITVQKVGTPSGVFFLVRQRQVSRNRLSGEIVAILQLALVIWIMMRGVGGGSGGFRSCNVGRRTDAPDDGKPPLYD